MRRVALIYNPASGQASSRHHKAIGEALQVFHAAGIEAEALHTRGPGDAATQAREAIRRGCDTVIACGGDGTVHEILQTLVGGDVALGVIPLGTANALAANLGLKLAPAKAARKLLDAQPQRVSAGRISYQNGARAPHARYFTVAAGVGADALFLSRLNPALKRRFGYILYLIEGFRVWATHSFPLFEAAFIESSTSRPRVEEISELLAIRIRDFGGVLRNLAPGASLHADGLRLVAFKTRSRFHYFRFLLAVLFGRQSFDREIEILDAVSVECRPRNRSRVRIDAEADGELLGHLPVRLEIVPDAFTLLIPPGARP